MSGLAVTFLVCLVIAVALLIYQHTPSGKKWVSCEE